MNENQINEICLKESKVQLMKEWLGILFFVAAAIVAVMDYKALSSTATDHGETAVTIMLVTRIVFVGLLLTGYFYNRFLSKKLDMFWEQKKLLF